VIGIGNELEKLLRSIVREELARLIGVEPEDVTDAEDEDVRRRVEERAAAWRRARGGGR